MSQDLKKYLYTKLTSIEGLNAIVCSDRDGVPVLKVANEKAPDYVLRTGFLRTFSFATEQAAKLNLGRNNYIISNFNSFTTIQFNRHPLTVTFVSSTDANTELILELGRQLDDNLLKGLKHLVQDCLNTYFTQA